MNKKQIRKMQTAAGGPLKFTPKEQRYLEWSKMTPEQKREYRANRAKSHLQSGPSITNFWEAFQSYVGNRDPENPHLNTGEAPTPGLGKISTIGNIVAKEYLINSGQNVIKSTDYLIKGIQGVFPKVNLSTILKNHKQEILDNGILSEFKNTGRFKNLMNEIQSEIEKVYGKSGQDAFNIIKVNPEGLPYRIGQEWSQKYDALFKQGGKMNIIEFLKNGSGIHIKEKNKGKFTKSAKAAGQSVQEHAKSVLNDPNATPLQKKRANFARNAAKWKHKKGGIIKAQQGTKTTTGVNNFLNSDFGQAIINGGLNLLQTGIQNEQTNAQSDASKAQNKLQWDQIAKQLIEQNRKDRNNQYLRWVYDYQSGLQLDRPSQIVTQHMGYQQLNQDLAEGKADLDYRNSLIDYQTRQKTAQNWGNAIEGVLQEGLKSLSSYLNNKKSTTSPTVSSSTISSPTTNSFWITPSLTKSFWNNSSLT